MSRKHFPLEGRYDLTGTLKGQANVSVILGSGLSGVVDFVKVLERIPYKEIEDISNPGVEGHTGEIILAELDRIRVFFFSGRFHIYEGAGAREVSFPIRVSKELGSTFLLITHAGGSLFREIKPLSWFLPQDFIAFPADSKLLHSVVRDWLLYATDMTDENAGSVIVRDRDFYSEFTLSRYCLDMSCRALLYSSMRKAQIGFDEGTLLWKAGPAYETASEVAFGQFLGASVVTMSSLPELIIANTLGIKSWPLSWVSNYTCNLTEKPIFHDEVLNSGEFAISQLKKIIASISHSLIV